MMRAERGGDLTQTTIMGWVRRYDPELEKRWPAVRSPDSNVLARR